MAKIDARGYIFEVESALVGETPATWLEVGGINSFEFNPDENNAVTETTTFASAGQYEGEAMQRGGKITCEGFIEVDDDTGERDPGQARIDELGTKVGRESLGKIRFRHMTEDTWIVWTGFVNPSAVGGGNNDKSKWGFAVTRSGAASTAAVEAEGPGGEGSPE